MKYFLVRQQLCKEKEKKAARTRQNRARPRNRLEYHAVISIADLRMPISTKHMTYQRVQHTTHYFVDWSSQQRSFYCVECDGDSDNIVLLRSSEADGGA